MRSSLAGRRTSAPRRLSTLSGGSRHSAGIFAGVASPSAAKPMDHSAYMLYRQGEWVSVPIRLSNVEAYQIFRRGEVASPLSNAEAYHLFRLGEWASINIPAVDLSAYDLSERTLIDPKAGLSIFLLSEHTLSDAQAGLTTYFNSERTRIPLRNLPSFNQYQISEWLVSSHLLGCAVLSSFSPEAARRTCARIFWCRFLFKLTFFHVPFTLPG